MSAPFSYPLSTRLNEVCEEKMVFTTNKTLNGRFTRIRQRRVLLYYNGEALPYNNNRLRVPDQKLCCQRCASVEEHSSKEDIEERMGQLSKKRTVLIPAEMKLKNAEQVNLHLKAPTLCNQNCCNMLNSHKNDSAGQCSQKLGKTCVKGCLNESDDSLEVSFEYNNLVNCDGGIPVTSPRLLPRRSRDVLITKYKWIRIRPDKKELYGKKHSTKVRLGNDTVDCEVSNPSKFSQFQWNKLNVFFLKYQRKYRGPTKEELDEEIDAYMAEDPRRRTVGAENIVNSEAGNRIHFPGIVSPQNMRHNTCEKSLYKWKRRVTKEDLNNEIDSYMAERKKNRLSPQVKDCDDFFLDEHMIELEESVSPLENTSSSISA